MLEVRRGSNNKVKLDLKGVVLEGKLEGLEVDLKGEAQVVGYLPGLDLKGEIEKGQAKHLCLTAGEID